ncbi:MAG: MBL fold metallo-hydrolase [Candidatus Thioglobus sp.]|nr:MBL fold metallo-hydrolase [Candidatus Thioglobus sp.]
MQKTNNIWLAKIKNIGLLFCLLALNSQAQNSAATGNPAIIDISTTELENLLNTNPNALLIDVRTQREINITGSILRGQNINIPRGWLEFRIAGEAPDKNTPIVVYCGQNLRSPLAAKTLLDMGYSNVKNYSAGYFAWQKAGNPVRISDYEIDNILYRKPVKVASNIYSAIGAAQPSTYENSNHNNNLSFIITTDGVLVFNAGGSYLLAKALHAEIRKITEQPVKIVVLENAQGHAILGSNYWRQQGAKIISHRLAKEEIIKAGDEIFEQTKNRIGDKISGTKVVLPDEVFEDKKVLKMGKTTIELLQLGPSHSADDIMLWLPAQKILISGDTAFNERLLPVFVHTHTGEWITTLDKLATLNPKIIIPGHGPPTDLATVMKFTKNYLIYMRQQVEKILDADGSLDDAYNIDQSQFRNWGTYRELYRQNAGRIFRQMEFE